MGCGRLRQWQADEGRAGFEWFGVVVGGGEEIDESAHLLAGFPGRENALAPLMDRSRMDSSQRFPAIQVFQCNGQIPGVCIDVSGNPPPHELAVLSPEVVVGDAHRWG